MKKILPWLLGIVILGGLIYTFYFLYQKSQQKPIVYLTEKASERTIIKKTVATGSIVPREEVDIKPQVSGIISAVFIEPGEQVKIGDPIAKVQVIPNMSSLNNAENRIKRARAELDNAQLEFDRSNSLFEKGALSQQEFQAGSLRLKNAKIEMQNAQDNLDIVKEGATKSSGRSAVTLVKSTVNGMVLQVPVKLGNQVIESNTFNDGTTVATVADMQDMIFLGKIDESEVGKIKEGMSLLLTIGAIENESFSAILEYISPKGALENGAIQFEIKANVNISKGSFIRAGFSANADIVLDRRDSVLTIDEKLLQFHEGKPYVEIKTGDQIFEKKDVKLGLSDGIYVEVLDGISKQDEIKVWNQVGF